MGLAANQARLNVLTCKKADLEYRLTIIASHEQLIATQRTEETTKRSLALTTFIQNLDISKENDEKVSFETTKEYMDYEQAMAEIDSADSRLTQLRKATETELHAVEAEEEEVEKLVSSNIKSSFGYFN